MKAYTLISLLPAAVMGCSSIAAGGDDLAPVTASFGASEPVATTLQPVVSDTPTTESADEQATETPSTGDDSNDDSSSGGGSTSGSCSAAVDELVGYGDGTTGGGDATPVVVTSCSELSSAVSAGGVVHIDGMLNGCDIMKVASDTSIIGVGAESGLVGGGFRLKDANNVIIRNLKLNNPPEGMDLIDIESSTYVWVDHCDFFCDGITGDKDKYDGLLDAKRGSDFLTFSWNKFSDHWKASLVGHSDSNGSQDQGTLHVTYHHNYWTNVNSRAPSIRFGTAHIYSSCYENLPTSGINSRMGATVLAESNSFSDVRRAIVTNLDSDEEGFAVDKNNLFSSSDIDITQEKDFTPPYTYTADAADCVCELVKAKAGTGVVGA